MNTGWPQITFKLRHWRKLLGVRSLIEKFKRVIDSPCQVSGRIAETEESFRHSPFDGTTRQFRLRPSQSIHAWSATLRSHSLRRGQVHGPLRQLLRRYRCWWRARKVGVVDHPTAVRCWSEDWRRQELWNRTQLPCVRFLRLPSQLRDGILDCLSRIRLC